MRPKYLVAAWDYPNQQMLYVGRKGLTTQLSQAMIVRSGKRAHRLAVKNDIPKRDMREAVLFDVWVLSK